MKKATELRGFRGLTGFAPLALLLIAGEAHVR